MAITDLTNTKWQFNNTISAYGGNLDLQGTISSGDYSVTSDDTYKYITKTLKCANKVMLSDLKFEIVGGGN